MMPLRKIVAANCQDEGKSARTKNNSIFVNSSGTSMAGE